MELLVPPDSPRVSLMPTRHSSVDATVLFLSTATNNPAYSNFSCSKSKFDSYWRMPRPLPSGATD
jgi:hypothetical protein